MPIRKPLNNLKSNIRKRELLKPNKEHLLLRKEFWPCNGQNFRYKDIFYNNLKKKPLDFLKKLNKKNPEVMFLGPGSGNTIVEFNKDLKKNKINPVFDIFSLTKNLDPKVKKQKLIRKDYSSNIGFEKLNTKNSKFKFLKEKYDLIIGAMSVGFHTKYPVNSLFTSAMMLKKNGRAYIEIADLRSVFDFKNEKQLMSFLKKLNISKKEIYSQKQIFVLQKVFDRFVRSYSPNKVFKLNKINYEDPKNYNENASFIEIIRKK
jgi:hypothetical protein